MIYKKVLLMLISQSRARPGLVWPPGVIGTTDIKLLLPQWGYTARTLFVVRWQKCADCNSVKPTRVIKSRACTERVEAPWRPWTLPAWVLRDKSHGAKHKQGQSASTEIRRTNPDSAAYYGGAWVTCIFELKKNLDFSIVQKMFFRQPVYRLRGLK